MKDFKYDNMILGADERCVVSMNCHETQLNNNVLVVGGSGSGKTMGVVNPMLFNIDNTNVVGIFTKKGVTRLAKKHLEEKGYTVYTMDFTNPERSCYGYDPLNYCKNSADVRDLAHAIVYRRQENEDRKDPFWDYWAENMIYLIFNTVFTGKYEGGNRTIDALNLLYKVERYGADDDADFNKLNFEFIDEETERRRILAGMPRRGSDRDCESEIERVIDGIKKRRQKEIDSLKEKYPVHYALRNLKKDYPRGFDIWKNFNEGAKQTSAAIAQSVMAPLDVVFNEEAVQLLDDGMKHFDFRELAKPKTVLFIYTSPVNPAYDGLIAIFYQQLFKCLFEMAEEMENGELNYPVQVICDDFATGAKVNGFDRKKIAATILIQSLSQLESLYGEAKATTIINNCDTQIFLGGMDIRSCQNVADRLNVQDSMIYELPVGRECFIRRGRKPFITERYDFLNDKAYLSAQKNQDKRPSRED